MATILTLRSSRVAIVDALREEHAGALTQAIAITSFALLTALGAHIRIYLWEVPITLQTAAVYASGLYLGWRNGMLAQLLYLAIGLFLPVYAGEGSGAAYIAGSLNGGYLIGFPIAAALTGLLSRQWKSLAGASISAMIGALVLFAVGVTWLHYAAGHVTWLESIDKGFLRFLSIDAAKVMLIGLLYAGTRRIG